MGHDWIAILDFGSQYTQLIARRIREQQVYCEILRFDTPVTKIAERNPRGIVLSGGPASVYDDTAPLCDAAVFDLGVPILGICYGMQLTAALLGGHVKPGTVREFGPARIEVTEHDLVFRELPHDLDVWMSHGDQVDHVPEGFTTIAKTDACPIAAMAHPGRKVYGLQFHPEVAHTPRGKEILHHFVFDACGCKGDWKMASFIQEQTEAIRARVGNDHVLCGLSGGVDSSVVAALLHRAIGPQLHCVFVDNGVLRRGEREQVEEHFGHALGIDLHVAHAAELFLGRLAGVIDPEQKRKIIGKTFIDVFSDEARKLTAGTQSRPTPTSSDSECRPPLRGGDSPPSDGRDKSAPPAPDRPAEGPALPRPVGSIRFLAQGTLYPDVIESVSPLGGPSVTIKSHHNVGGLPPDLKFELLEPLRELFKDEVRALGRELGLPSRIVDRQPFPGPGLAVRILGEVTVERVALLQQADLRVQEEVAKLENYRDIWQSFAVLLPVQSVGVMGDGRTYENVVAVRAVRSLDGMTADWYRLPYETLDRIATRIINEVRGVNRVVYDISSKPPATIEWE